MDALAKIGIYPRQPTADENITVSLRRGVFRQPIEGKAEMDDPEYTVVVARLTPLELEMIVEAYTAVSGQDFSNLEKIAALLGEQVNRYHETVPATAGLEGYTKWLQEQRAGDKAAGELAKALDDLSEVFIRMSRIGLTKKEIAICKNKICSVLKGGMGVDVKEILPLIEGAAKKPTEAPRPGFTPPVAPEPAPVPPPAEGAPVLPAPEPLPPPPDGGAAAPAAGTTPPPAPPPPAPDAPATPKAE